jgi:hypothetical protein
VAFNWCDYVSLFKKDLFLFFRNPVTSLQQNLVKPGDLIAGAKTLDADAFNHLNGLAVVMKGSSC